MRRAGLQVGGVIVWVAGWPRIRRLLHAVADLDLYGLPVWFADLEKLRSPAELNFVDLRGVLSGETKFVTIVDLVGVLSGSPVDRTAHGL